MNRRVELKITFYELAFEQWQSTFSVGFSEEKENCRRVAGEGCSVEGGDFKVGEGIRMLIWCVWH